MCLSNCNSVCLVPLQFLFFCLSDIWWGYISCRLFPEESRLDSAGGATDKPTDAPCALCALFSCGNPAIGRKRCRCLFVRTLYTRCERSGSPKVYTFRLIGIYLLFETYIPFDWKLYIFWENVFGVQYHRCTCGGTATYRRAKSVLRLRAKWRMPWRIPPMRSNTELLALQWIKAVSRVAPYTFLHYCEVLSASEG